MIPIKYIEKLRSDLAGRLIESRDPGYDQLLVIDNGRLDLRPGVVAICANAQDVTRPTNPLLTNWKQEFYGGNYERLARIKKEWDPKNQFSFQRAIGSPFEPTPGNFAPLFRTSID